VPAARRQASVSGTPCGVTHRAAAERAALVM
jgi:hypothetical protein